MAYGTTFYPSQGIAKSCIACRYPQAGDRIKIFFRKQWLPAIVVEKGNDDRGHYFIAKTEEYLGSSFLGGYGLCGPLSNARDNLWIFAEEDPHHIDPLYSEQERPMTSEEIESCDDENLPF